MRSSRVQAATLWRGGGRTCRGSDRLAGVVRAARREPARVRPPPREPALDRAVELEAPARGVDGEHLPGPSRPRRTHEPAGSGTAPASGRARDETVVRDRPAQRAQPVPVERRADDAPVGEDDRRGAVPRLDEAGVIAKNARTCGSSSGFPLPRRRHEHRERVPHVAPAANEQLERVVEHRRVGAALVEHRPEPRLVEARRAARIAATFPASALISPLWQSRRNGCARSHDGDVFVEKRWWKIANGTASHGSRRSA